MRTSIVFVYNSFKDPLFQATLWLYLVDESARNRFRFLLITYEQEEFFISEQEKNRIKEDLAAMNIVWLPLKWHSGSFKLVKKLFDLVLALALIARIYARFKPKTIISLGTVAGSFSYLLSRMFGLKNYIYQYERHSEFLADFNIWNRKSISFRMLNYFERLSGKNSEILATGTSHMMKRLEEEKVRGTTYLLPSCVDDQHFQFSGKDRELIRNSLGIGTQKAVIYLGKFGGIYFSLKKIVAFFREWKHLDSSVFFIILTPEDAKEVERQLIAAGIEESSFHVGRVPHHDVPKYLSASDIGVVAVPSLPSQKFRSPIKVGEYLCCGLPFIVGRGISDDDQIAKEKSVGVVLDSYDRAGLEKVMPEIQQLVSEDKEVLRRRCRSAGLSYRGFSRLVSTGKQIFDKLASF